jgi:hypothetical protein
VSEPTVRTPFALSAGLTSPAKASSFWIDVASKPEGPGWVAVVVCEALVQAVSASTAVAATTASLNVIVEEVDIRIITFVEGTAREPAGTVNRRRVYANGQDRGDSAPKLVAGCPIVSSRGSPSAARRCAEDARVNGCPFDSRISDVHHQLPKVTIFALNLSILMTLMLHYVDDCPY